MGTSGDRRETAASEPVVAAGRRALPLALLVLVVCLGATYAFWRQQQSDARRILRDAFEFRADEAARRIEGRLRRYEQLLRGAAALAAASERLTGREFRTYVDSLQLAERYPEIRAIGLAVTQDTPQRASVLYLERFGSATDLQPGSDLGSDSVRREALQRAHGAAAPALSGAIIAPGAGGEMQRRFDVFFPLFDRLALDETSGATGPISGWMFAEVSAQSMMGRLFGESLWDAGDDIDIRIHDGTGISTASLLYGAPGGDAPRGDPADELRATRPLAFGLHQWTLEMRALPGFASASGPSHANLLAIAGIAGSLLLAGLTWLLATGRSRARAAAARMNRDLIASEAQLRELNEELERRVARRTRELETYAERLALAVKTSNTGLWDWNLLTREVHYSREWAGQLGLEPHELGTGIDEWESRLHPEDRERAVHALHEHMASPGNACEMEFRLRHHDGSYRTILCRSQTYADTSGKPVRVVGSHLDITERKRAEDALVKLARELRQAWRQISKVEEADRRWLASELHDSIGAALTALNLNLTIVRERLPDEARPALEPRLKDSIALLEETVETVRGLMAQLRPPVLDDYGLATAVRWYIDQIAGRTDIKTTFRHSGEDLRLAAESEIALFRIAQGALTNVLKHSGAHRLEASIEVTKAALKMTIADDGRGFAPERTHADLGSPHWGLVTMRERAESIGGRCTIDSSPGHGTRVAVELPR